MDVHPAKNVSIGIDPYPIDDAKWKDKHLTHQDICGRQELVAGRGQQNLTLTQ